MVGAGAAATSDEKTLFFFFFWTNSTAAANGDEIVFREANDSTRLLCLGEREKKRDRRLL